MKGLWVMRKTFFSLRTLCSCWRWTRKPGTLRLRVPPQPFDKLFKAKMLLEMRHLRVIGRHTWDRPLKGHSAKAAATDEANLLQRFQVIFHQCFWA